MRVTATILLASRSPRRRELIALGGWDFELTSVEADESPFAGELPLDYVRRVAETKARLAAAAIGATLTDPMVAPGHAPTLQPPSAAIIVAADTTVADGNAILGKPAGVAEARAMLRRLRGRTHQVHTALAAIQPGDPRLQIETCTTEVPMRDYRDDEIEAYIAGGDPFDKAGGYAIQHRGFHPVAGIQGCYANVVGLPLCHLQRLLSRIGIDTPADVARSCQQALGYDCPVYPAIQAGLL